MKCVEGLVEADGSCTLGNVDTARRTIHMTHYVLGIHNCPAPPQTTCSGGRPIAPTAMWERATGRFESPAATGSPFSSKSAIVCSLRTLCQKRAARALALLEADELVYLLRAIDAFAESDPQHLHVLSLEWRHGNLSRLSAVSYLRKRTVPFSPELPPWRRDVVASDG
jgi:hypothetical protein